MTDTDNKSTRNSSCDTEVCDTEVMEVSITKKRITGNVVVRATQASEEVEEYSVVEYVFPYNRMTGRLGRVRLPYWYDEAKRKSWIQTVAVVPEKVWEKLDEKDYDISKAEEVCKKEYGEDLV